MEEQVKEMELTPEELNEKREQMLQFYTESMPYLKAQADYEETLLKIDEARWKRTNIQMQYAMMAAQQEEAEAADSPEALREEIKQEGKRLKKN
jgi:DNA-binding transcriptional regulator GbsR (MarR family)